MPESTNDATLGTFVAESWRELDDLLFHGAWNPELQRYRPQQAYRGGSRVGRELRSGLLRLGGNPAEKERHLVRNFRKYARRSFVGDDSIWNWLALAEHHGLPTRLLDWSYSPYVALHFATVPHQAMDQDGEVWVADFTGVNDRLPGRLRTLLEAEGSSVFTGEMLSVIARSLDDLGRIQDEPFMLFLEPPSLSERITNQAALFSLMSDPNAVLDDWFRRHPETRRRIVIPAALKWEVRDRLDQINVNERVLFPGLDGLSSWLARYYRNR